MVLLIPYIRSRISIVTPRRTSNLVLIAALVILIFQLVMWGVSYYQVELVSTTGISTLALVLKDVILVSSMFVFALLTARLVRWYGRTRNIVVLLFAGLAAGTIAFSGLHLLSDHVAKSSLPVLTRILGIAFMFVIWTGDIALILLLRAYYGRIRTVYLIPTALVLGSLSIVTGSAVLAIAIDPSLRTVTLFGLAMAGPVYLWSYLLLVPALPNQTARGYYRGVGYGIGLNAASTCGMGLGLPLSFPLSGFPSLMILLPGAALAFAAFTSCASYFSISEDVRKQIRKAESFVTSIGEAEKIISTERQVSGFYDRFTGMARVSGAVEATAISKEEIYSYASALKKIQSTRIGKVA